MVSKQDSHPVAVVGARGYSGLELCSLLLKRTDLELKGAVATDAKWNLGTHLTHPKAAQIPVYSMQNLDELAGAVKSVFLATPAETSLELAPKLLKKGVNVIDLSGAFRLDSEGAENYSDWYGHAHPAPELLEKAQYGLVPWAKPFSGRTAQLIANPGCYATSILMALLPVLKNGLIDPESVVIDAKSGTTGAGKKAAENLLFSEVDGECLPYRVGKHQHLPEIRKYAKNFAATEFNPFFTTNLLPTRRGIIAGIYAKLNANVKIADINEAFAKAYADYPLCSFGAAEPSLLSLKRVSGTARTHISYFVESEKLYLFSCIDNLMKGAASQALENLNRLLDLPPATGLTEIGGLT